MNYSEIAQRLKTEKRFQPPSGWRWGYFTNADGARLRYGRAVPEAPAATVVLVPGFCECGEKYFEVVHDLLARNLAVWELDWRGQGGSERYFPGLQRPYAAGYARDVGDLHQFVSEIVERAPGSPLALFGHSMGGNIALRYLHDHPGIFACAALAAPMLGLKTPVPGTVAEGIVRCAIRLGHGARYVPGWGDWHPGCVDRPKGLSSDPVRDSLQNFWFMEQPELRVGGTTFRWLDEAFRSVAIVREPDYLRAIATPVLMASPKIEWLVEPEAQVRAAALLPRCTLVEYPEARHELWMERDALRDRWLAAIDAFLSKHLALPARAEGREVPAARANSESV